MQRTRIVAIAGLVVAVALVAVLLLGGGSSYQVTARFPEAGQMVKGGLVEVGGRPVGKIKDIKPLRRRRRRRRDEPDQGRGQAAEGLHARGDPRGRPGQRHQPLRPS